jgi:hypothetical protein
VFVGGVGSGGAEHVLGLVLSEPLKIVEILSEIVDGSFDFVRL